MSIDELKKERVGVVMNLQSAVQPLQDRLATFGFIVWWGGVEYKINTSRFGEEEFDQTFPLHDAQLGYLMAMSDDELFEYCKNWGRNETTTT